MDNGVEPKKSNPWRLAILVAVLILAASGWYFYSLNQEERNLPNQTSQPVEETGPPALETTGSDFFQIKAENGQFVPKELKVKYGQFVEIEFTAVDDKYDIGFVEPTIGFDVIVEKGDAQTFGFETKDKRPGVYKFKCFQFCPRGEMEGVLTME